MNKNELLKRCLLFSSLDASAIDGLSAISMARNFQEREIVFSEGNEATSLHILDSGRIDLVKTSPDGREMIVRSVKPGEVFAEAAVFSGSAYPATAIARVDSSILSIDKKKFISFISLHPDVSLKMMGVMSGLLRHMNALLSELSLESVGARLAIYILKRSKTDGKSFELGMRKMDLALKLGTIPETLSRNLKKMSADGVIEVAGGKIIIKNIKMLSEWAGR